MGAQIVGREERLADLEHGDRRPRRETNANWRVGTDRPGRAKHLRQGLRTPKPTERPQATVPQQDN